jgi:hypothetical protein
MVVSASIEISVIASVRFSSALSMSMIYAFATKLPTPAIENLNLRRRFRDLVTSMRGHLRAEEEEEV